MPWGRLDDRLHAHPKVRQAWRANRDAVGLYALALTYANFWLTDGRIGREFVADLFPDTQEGELAAEVLVEAGLWEVSGDGWRIHDFLDYNDPAEKVRAWRSAREEKRKANRRRLADERRKERQ